MTIDAINEFKCKVDSCTAKKKSNGYCEKHQFMITAPETYRPKEVLNPSTTSPSNNVTTLLQVFGVVWIVAGIGAGVYQGQLNAEYDFDFFSFIAFLLSGSTIGVFLFGLAEVIRVLSSKNNNV